MKVLSLIENSSCPNRLCAPLFDIDPAGLQQREGDQTNDRGHSDKQRVADLETEQDREAANSHEYGKPIADRDLAEQNARAEDRADGGGIGALYKSFDTRIGAVPDQDGSDNQNQQERGEKYTYGRDERAPEPGDEIAYKGGGDDDGTGADHADRHRHQKLASVDPARLLHQPFFEKGHDDETAAESETSGFEKEGEQSAKNVEVCRLRADAERHERHQRPRRRLTAAQQRAVVQDADNPGNDEEDRDLGLEPNRHDKTSGRNDPLQPVLHTELGETVAGMKDQGDNGRAHAIEDRRHPGQPAKMHVQRAERRDDQEIRQDKGPAAGPRTPEAAAQI